MNKEQGYKVTSSTFNGCNVNGHYSYTITFNKSLGHTGRFTGIEEGLDEYVRKEAKTNFKKSFSNIWYSFKYWVKQL